MQRAHRAPGIAAGGVFEPADDRGLALPPKMPTELTQAMPLARAGPVRNTAGNGNKWAFDAYRPIVASDSPSTAQ